ncbi:MFS transporter [Georgenia yuyongxinii]|uniref:MFS transporter n=1 Tax=Georgenia yuyongxinii TaxID=2589797 RepID=UPI0022AA6B27|nr:MFS transporter [Georgenia yuyongxinii]
MRLCFRGKTAHGTSSLSHKHHNSVRNFWSRGVATLASLPAGHAVDRLGSRVLLTVIPTLTAAALAFFVLDLSLVSLGVVVLVSGVAQAAANPATNRSFAGSPDHFARARTMGIKQSGIPASQFVVGAGLPPLAALVGLRMALVPLLVASVVIALWARRRAVGARLRASERSSRTRTAMPAAVWPLLGVSFFAGVATQATNAFLPLFAHADLGLSPSVAGSVVAVVGGIGILGRFFWTWQFGRTRHRRRTLPLLALGGVTASAMLAVSASLGASGAYWIAAVIHASTTLAITGVVFERDGGRSARLGGQDFRTRRPVPVRRFRSRSPRDGSPLRRLRLRGGWAFVLVSGAASTALAVRGAPPKAASPMVASQTS